MSTPSADLGRIPPSLTPEHIPSLSIKAKALASGAESTTDLSGNEDLSGQLLDAASRLFLDKYGFEYADSKSTPPDLKPESSVTVLRAFVTVPVDDLKQVRTYSEAQFANEVTVRVEQLLNVSDPDRWEHSALKASYGNPDNANDRIEVRTVYLYTDIKLSDGSALTVAYYIGVYYRAT
ncbi:hypothetical protein C0991_011508 [Blastosporella zonata]|nr:hypothetical protein C0991_011508 [Blastosporella zonata]